MGYCFAVVSFISSFIIHEILIQKALLCVEHRKHPEIDSFDTGPLYSGYILADHADTPNGGRTLFLLVVLVFVHVVSRVECIYVLPYAGRLRFLKTQNEINDHVHSF